MVELDYAAPEVDDSGPALRRVWAIVWMATALGVLRTHAVHAFHDDQPFDVMKSLVSWHRAFAGTMSLAAAILLALAWAAYRDKARLSSPAAHGALLAVGAFVPLLTLGSLTAPGPASTFLKPFALWSFTAALPLLIPFVAALGRAHRSRRRTDAWLLAYLAAGYALWLATFAAGPPGWTFQWTMVASAAIAAAKLSLAVIGISVPRHRRSAGLLMLTIIAVQTVASLGSYKHARFAWLLRGGLQSYGNDPPLSASDWVRYLAYLIPAQLTDRVPTGLLAIWLIRDPRRDVTTRAGRIR